jgi:hypothetical protein
MYNDTEMFVDPLSLVLKSHAVIVRCNDMAPPRFEIRGYWYCLYSGGGLGECHDPGLIPISLPELGPDKHVK